MDDITLSDEVATLALGARLANCVEGGLTVWLRGDLGAGKTTLSRGLLRGLGFEGKVKSPTYALVESYVISGLTIYHFDLYRFYDEEEWEAVGFREHFNSHSLCLVEWPEKAANLLPAADLEIALQVADIGRKATIMAHTQQGKKCLERL
jgi:tRNA threonylcarbamoyladenosine biosynthesis protein TsaE